MSVINELNQLADITRKQIKEYAEASVRFYKLEGIEKESAKTYYLTMAKQSDGYQQLKTAIEGILRDCVVKYKMEKWMAESLLGINLDKEFLIGFEHAWKKLNGIQA